MNKQISTIIATLLCLTSTCYGQTNGFNLKSETTVRDILEGHQKTPTDTYYLMALSAAQKGNMEDAFKAINTGLKLNSTNVNLLNLQAALYAKQGKLIDARRNFLLVLGLDPSNSYARQNLAIVEHLMQPKRNVDQLIQKPKTIPKIEPPTTPISESQTEKDEKKLLEAEYFIEVKSKQECYHNMSLLKRAIDAKKEKSPKSKEEDFTPEKLLNEKYIVSLPICPKSGSYEFKDNDIVCSSHGTLSELGTEVTNVFSEFNKGMRSKQARNYLDALKSFEQVVILYPKWGEAHFQLGDTLFKLGETDAAISSVRESLKYDKKNTDAELLLANLYFKKGMKQAALNILDRIASTKKGSVYAFSARSIAKSIRSGRSYYELFPPQ